MPNVPRPRSPPPPRGSCMDTSATAPRWPPHRRSAARRPRSCGGAGAASTASTEQAAVSGMASTGETGVVPLGVTGLVAGPRAYWDGSVPRRSILRDQATAGTATRRHRSPSRPMVPQVGGVRRWARWHRWRARRGAAPARAGGADPNGDGAEPRILRRCGVGRRRRGRTDDVGATGDPRPGAGHTGPRRHEPGSHSRVIRS